MTFIDCPWCEVELELGLDGYAADEVTCFHCSSVWQLVEPARELALAA